MTSLRKRLFSVIAILVLTAVFSTAVLVEAVGYYSLLGSMKAGVKNESALIVTALNAEGDNGLYSDFGSSTSNRLTLINTDGTVLYDSWEADVSSLENHAQRSEVASAMERGYGESTRYSETLGKTTYYYAARLNDGKIIRVAGTIDSVLNTLAGGFWYILLFIAALLLMALVLTQRLTEKIVKPINNLDLAHPMCNNIYEEIHPLLLRVDEQNRTISRQIEAIRQSREENLAITENMQDGLIVTNTVSVLSLNRAAMHFFHVQLKDVEGRSILTISREPEIKAAWDRAVAGAHSDSRFEMDGCTYELLGNPVLIDGKISGAVLLILDITEKVKTEDLRREFTANVSHELKTPLMSISGYAELIENGIAADKDIPEFAGKIRSEAARLTSLVEDIIRLSELDEKKDAGNETADLLSIAREAADNLNFAAHRMKISLFVEGCSAILTGSRQLLYEMTRNLIDNGIKYNHPGGFVRVAVGKKTMENEKNLLYISVKDDGIGIPQEDTERIFERFFRVDKSHSRATGGTGLGLSIVKHAALLHRGSIKVNSKIGEGTEITIFFPDESPVKDGY